MSVGLRIYKHIQRPKKELLERAAKIPAANLDDNMGRIYAVEAAIKPVNKVPLCGPAFTVKAPSGDNLMFHKALSMAQEGDVIVISGVGESERSFCGELMLSYARKKKLGGFVIDGYIRDIDGFREADFPCYCRGVQPNGPYKNGPGEINVPVAVGRQVIMPGDILVGDQDGLVVIPLADAEECIAAGEATFVKEDGLLQKWKAGTMEAGDKPWVEEKLAKLEVPIYD